MDPEVTIGMFTHMDHHGSPGNSQVNIGLFTWTNIPMFVPSLKRNSCFEAMTVVPVVLTDLP